MNYYFLVASLPDIAMETAPSISMERFLSQCENSLVPSDMDALEEIMERTGVPGYAATSSALDTERKEVPSAALAFTRTLEQREAELRNMVVLSRAARTNADPAPHLRESDAWNSSDRKAVEDAIGRGNPKEVEQALDAIRWAVIDDTAGLDAFRAEAVFAYGLQLRIAERWAKMDAESGNARINEIVSSLVENSGKQDDVDESNTNQHKAE